MNHSDIYIMLPISGNLKESGKHAKDDLAIRYNKELSETARYECDEAFADTIKRKEIGGLLVSYMSDEYNEKDVEWLEGFCCCAYQKQSDLGILQICIPSCSKEDSQIGDIVFTGHMKIQHKSRRYSISDFVKALGFSQVGKIRIVYCNSLERKSEEQLAYLLAGETAASEHIDYKISPEMINELIQNEISKYDFYELYASQKSLVYLLKDFSSNFLDNIENEALLLYICEVAMLQNAAISRINGQITDELMQNSDISSRRTLKLQVEFGKTIMLWDNMVYKYYMSQELSNDIVRAFGTDRLFEDYSRNSSHIEQIAALKSGIASDVEGKILNVLAFVLSISQVIALVRNLIDYASVHPVTTGISGGTIALVVVVLAIVRRKFKM